MGHDTVDKVRVDGKLVQVIQGIVGQTAVVAL